MGSACKLSLYHEEFDRFLARLPYALPQTKSWRSSDQYYIRSFDEWWDKDGRNTIASVSQEYTEFFDTVISPKLTQETDLLKYFASGQFINQYLENANRVGTIRNFLLKHCEIPIQINNEFSSDALVFKKRAMSKAVPLLVSRFGIFLSPIVIKYPPLVYRPILPYSLIRFAFGIYLRPKPLDRPLGEKDHEATSLAVIGPFYTVKNLDICVIHNNTWDCSSIEKELRQYRDPENFSNSIIHELAAVKNGKEENMYSNLTQTLLIDNPTHTDLWLIIYSWKSNHRYTNHGSLGCSRASIRIASDLRLRLRYKLDSFFSKQASRDYEVYENQRHEGVEGWNIIGVIKGALSAWARKKNLIEESENPLIIQDGAEAVDFLHGVLQSYLTFKLQPTIVSLDSIDVPQVKDPLEVKAVQSKAITDRPVKLDRVQVI